MGYQVRVQPPGAGFTEFDTLADLAAFNAAVLVAGCPVFVSTPRSYWCFDPTSTLTPNGTTTVAAVGGGNWILQSYEGISATSFLPYYPIGGGADDWPSMLAKLNVATILGISLLFMPVTIAGTPSVITCATAPGPYDIPNGARIEFAPGASVNSTLPQVDGHSSTPFYRNPLAAPLVNTTTLGSAPVLGTSILTVASSAGLAVAQDLYIAGGGGELNSGYTVTALGVGIVGTTDITAAGLYGGGGSLAGKTLILNVNGGGALTLNLVGAGNAASRAALFAAIVAEWPALTVQQGGSTGKELVLLASTSIVVGAGSANANLGIAAPTAVGTVITERPILKPFPYGSTVAITPGFAYNISIEGNEALCTGTGDRYVQIVMGRNCHVRRLRFQGTNVQQFTCAFDYGGVRCSFEYCAVINATGGTGFGLEDNEFSGIESCYCSGVQASGLVLNECNGCYINNSAAENCADGVVCLFEAPDAYGTHNCVIFNCQSLSNTGDGFKLWTATNVDVIGCTSQYNALSGFNCENGGTEVRFTGCCATNNGTYGLHLNSGGGGFYVANMRTADNGTAGVFAGGTSQTFVNLDTNEPGAGITVPSGQVVTIQGWRHNDGTAATGFAGLYCFNATGCRMTVNGARIETLNGPYPFIVYGSGSLLVIDQSIVLPAVYCGVYIGNSGTARIGTSVDVSATTNKFIDDGTGKGFNRGSVALTGAVGVAVKFGDIKSTDQVLFSLQTVGGTQGPVPSYTITPGTGFTVTGTAADTSVYNYRVLS